MIRIDEIWLATEPFDMRAGPDKVLARVIQVFGAAWPNANRRGNRLKAPIHDGFGIWLCTRRLHRCKFHRRDAWRGDQLCLNEEQLAALAATGRRCRDLGAVTTRGSRWLYAQHHIAHRARAWHTVGMTSRPDHNAFSAE